MPLLQSFKLILLVSELPLLVSNVSLLTTKLLTGDNVLDYPLLGHRTHRLHY